jgi:heme-degrading monooxygenase HmoA
MIARIWHGRAPRATADDYQRHYESEVSGHLRGVTGFRGARLLRQDAGDEVTFTSIVFFTSIDAVRGFAGEDFEQAVVEETARRVLSRWDERVSHHEVAVDVP